VEPAGLPLLPRPVSPQGPFVDPGTYSIRIEAGATVATQTVEVRGDPLLPLTAAQWREREDFLLAVQADLRRAADAAERARRLPDSLQAVRTRVNNVRRDLGALAAEFNGRGVRQGSLFPPTNTHRQRHRMLQAALAEVTAELPAVDR
jgi:hypothetical protein